MSKFHIFKRKDKLSGAKPEYTKKVVFDSETTGLNVNAGDRLIEIGAVELDDKDHPTGALFHVYINPQRDVPQKATKIHGLTTEFLKDYPTFNMIKDDFLKFIEGKELIAHNLPFELSFLNYELGFELPNKATDTLMIAKKMFPKATNTLDSLCRRFSINIADIPYKGGLLDAYCLAGVYRKLMQIL